MIGDDAPQLNDQAECIYHLGLLLSGVVLGQGGTRLSTVSSYERRTFTRENAAIIHKSKKQQPSVRKPPLRGTCTQGQ